MAIFVLLVGKSVPIGKSVPWNRIRWSRKTPLWTQLRSRFFAFLPIWYGLPPASVSLATSTAVGSPRSLSSLTLLWQVVFFSHDYSAGGLCLFAVFDIIDVGVSYRWSVERCGGGRVWCCFSFRFVPCWLISDMKCNNATGFCLVNRCALSDWILLDECVWDFIFWCFLSYKVNL